MAKGAELIREVLVAAGVARAPRNETAGSYDPPLSACEQRHRYHVLQQLPFPRRCRFCAEALAGALVRFGA